MIFLKIFRILNEEGIKGFYQRLRMRFLYIIKPKITKSAYGVKLYSNWGDATFNLCLSGTYGYFFSDFLKNISRPYNFIDIGANQGIYSLVAAKNKNFKKIYSFEPVTENFKLLKKNIKLNNLKNVISKKFAISDKNAVNYISYNKEHSGSSSLEIKKKYSKKLIKINTINYTKLKKFINLKNPLIVKIDVEGHESVVIDQLIKSNLMKNVEFIYVEIDFKINTIGKIKNKIKKFNYVDVYRSKTINYHSDFLFKKR